MSKYPVGEQIAEGTTKLLKPVTEEDSVAVTYQGTTLDKEERLVKKLGELDNDSFELIKTNLRKQLDL